MKRQADHRDGIGSGSNRRAVWTDAGLGLRDRNHGSVLLQTSAQGSRSFADGYGSSASDE
jgi:hypothetical protein